MRTESVLNHGNNGCMAETINRALQLLNMLQAHRHWTGTELSRRLGVTERTVRRDIDRLRELGYRIESTPGVAGGYRLEAGSAVPPLLLTDEEAVTMAIGLRVAATQRLVHGPETTLTALAKLEQVLPAALRRRVNALAAVVQPVGIGSAPTVSPDILGELALACRDHERLRFTYTSAAGETTIRRVEPHALSPAERNWYLLCWDLEREDWRTFRVDRLDAVQHTRVLFEPRPLTAEQTEEFFRVAPPGCASRSRPTSSWTSRTTRCASTSGSGGRARRPSPPTPPGGRSAAPTSARRCTGCRGSRPACHTRPIWPSRRAASCARRSCGCWPRSTQRLLRRGCHIQTHSETPGNLLARKVAKG